MKRWMVAAVMAAFVATGFAQQKSPSSVGEGREQKSPSPLGEGRGEGQAAPKKPEPKKVAAKKPAPTKPAPTKPAPKKPAAKPAPPAPAAPAAKPNVTVLKSGQRSPLILRDKDGNVIPTSPDAYDVSSAVGKK